MMHAYNKQYLDDAMRNLGEAFDYVANACKMDMDEFLNLFIAGGIAKQFGAGVPKYVSGMSGVELAWKVLENSGKDMEMPDVEITYERTPEYWCGWILAYYQWYTGNDFKKIKQHISMDEIYGLYPTLHEASEEKFLDVMAKRISRDDLPTQLQMLRRAIGYSQKMLADKSGVTLRMIQQYEQRAKDINKASGANLAALAQILGCRMEDLMEG